MSVLRNGKNRLKRNQEDEKGYYKKRKDQEKWKKRKQTCYCIIMNYCKLMKLSLFCDTDIKYQESFPPPDCFDKLSLDQEWQ
ncbi:hypothetical protein AJ79_04622 [Helicocarpus griseus UAMH5409]|uniref:Uncharacterized protein n=1 Tax=Helicocarpus griseus UAMH5409 TaxID=1447875 RepID=A0A2B7XS94_9EURO|nr:hypothetical protein AJ79_04622 [Helicocarpus griseus UAMH5409]